MGKGKRRDPRLEAYWRRQLVRRRESGLSVRAFCEREGLAESACHAWRRIIRQRDQERQPQPGPQPGILASPAPGFLKLRVADAPLFPADAAGQGQTGSPILIELRGGRMMHLPCSMPISQLAAVLRAVEEAA